VSSRPARFAGILLLSAMARVDPAPCEPAARTWEVRQGDTLWSIAEAAIGDPSLWPALYRANRDRIKDPSRVYPGQLLTVPEVPPESIRAVRREALELMAR
jgi:nucleoid-associated protein YgaU